MKKVFLAAAFAALTATASYAGPIVPVYDTAVGPGDLVGSRSAPANIFATASYAGITVSWNIGRDPVTNVWTYTYTFTGFPLRAPGISHWILDLSENCFSTAAVGAAQDCVFDAEYSTGDAVVGLGSFDGSDPSNPGMPGTITGVKFDETSEGSDFLEDAFITFLSMRAPVWGDMYGKGASDQYFYNLGLANHQSTDVNDFIARPDTDGGGEEDGGGEDGSSPEPATLALFGLGLVAAGRRLRR